MSVRHLRIELRLFIAISIVQMCFEICYFLFFINSLRADEYVHYSATAVL